MGKTKEQSEAQQRIAAAGGTCQCRGECGHMHPGDVCAAPHQQVVCRYTEPEMASFWVPLDKADPSMKQVKIKLGVVVFGKDDGTEELKVFCQRCRLRVDRFVNAARARASRKRRAREKLAWAELPRVR